MGFLRGGVPARGYLGRAEACGAAAVRGGGFAGEGWFPLWAAAGCLGSEQESVFRGLGIAASLALGGVRGSGF